MSTHNLFLEQKYEKYKNFLSENFHFLVVKFSVYLKRHVFVMDRKQERLMSPTKSVVKTFTNEVDFKSIFNEILSQGKKAAYKPLRIHCNSRTRPRVPLFTTIRKSCISTLNSQSLTFTD